MVFYRLAYFLFLNSKCAHNYYQGDLMDKDLCTLLNKLPIEVKEFYLSVGNITEIRIRKENNIIVVSKGKNYILDKSVISTQELEDIFLSLCDYTLSAYEEQIANGFITLSGGHRVGIAGSFSTDIDGKKVLADIYSLNIRLSVFHIVNIEKGILNFNKGLLICGKPHSGKTTFIKNICRCINGINYTVCDERNEIYHSSLNGDFIINLPKATAIMQAVRVMNPDIIVCDEIGTSEETTKMLEYMNSGVKFICSVHCSDYADLFQKTNITPLISAGVFDKIVFLDYNDNNFFVKEIVDV